MLLYPLQTHIGYKGESQRFLNFQVFIFFDANFSNIDECQDYRSMGRGVRNMSLHPLQKHIRYTKNACEFSNCMFYMILEHCH